MTATASRTREYRFSACDRVEIIDTPLRGRVLEVTGNLCCGNPVLLVEMSTGEIIYVCQSSLRPVLAS